MNYSVTNTASNVYVTMNDGMVLRAKTEEMAHGMGRAYSEMVAGNTVETTTTHDTPNGTVVRTTWYDLGDRYTPPAKPGSMVRHRYPVEVRTVVRMADGTSRESKTRTTVADAAKKVAKAR